MNLDDSASLCLPAGKDVRRWLSARLADSFQFACFLSCDDVWRGLVRTGRGARVVEVANLKHVFVA